MKKIIGFIMCVLMLLVASTPIFAQTTTSTVAGVDTATIFEVISAVLAAIIGHFTINSKWASVIKWVLTLLKWLVSVFEILNKSNAGETVTETTQKPVNTNKISDPIPAPNPVQTITDQVAAASQVADVQPTTQPPTITAQ